MISCLTWTIHTMDFLPGLFHDKLTEDNREPFLTCMSLPRYDGCFDVYAPRLLFWIQLFYVSSRRNTLDSPCRTWLFSHAAHPAVLKQIKLLLVQVSILCVYAFIIHSFIIKNRGAQWTYLLGYGILIPSVLQIPYPLIDYLGVTNRVLRTSLTILPSNVTFRCIEAMHGTSPICVEDSLTNYLIYYSSVVDFMWDKKTGQRTKNTMKGFFLFLFHIIIQIVMLSPLLSILFHYDYKPFPSNVVLEKYNFSLELIKPAQLMNNYAYTGKSTS